MARKRPLTEKVLRDIIMFWKAKRGGLADDRSLIRYTADYQYLRDLNQLKSYIKGFAKDGLISKELARRTISDFQDRNRPNTWSPNSMEEGGPFINP